MIAEEGALQALRHSNQHFAEILPNTAFYSEGFHGFFDLDDCLGGADTGMSLFHELENRLVNEEVGRRKAS